MQTAAACFLGLLHASLFFQNNDLREWVPKQLVVAKAGMYANISREGAAVGSVVAATSRENPDYFYHWIRDAALVMDTVVSMYERASTDGERKKAKDSLIDYVAFSRENQRTPNPSGGPADKGFGEPKFEANGSAFTRGWGRPQNDGPALRAQTLIRFANLLLNAGEEDWVRGNLYSGEVPAFTVIKSDLEYVSHHWSDYNFDIWEETYGQHFYTLMAHRSAMIDGGRLADRLGDKGAADWYFKQAALIEEKINQHWDPSRGIVVATLPGDYVPHKGSGLDSATILGVLHSNRGDGFFGVTDDKIVATALALETRFAELYPINQRNIDDVEPAIGRYPEDKYTGVSLDGPGNPWVLTTLGFAEYYYRLANALDKRGEIRVTPRSFPFFEKLKVSIGLRPYMKIDSTTPGFQEIILALRKKGDRYLNRIRIHSPGDGKWAEQLELDSGYMRGAPELTWGYVSFLTALFQRAGGNVAIYF
jgi:glucoamylase